MQELCRELKGQHVGYPEKRVAEVLLAWTRAKDAFDAQHQAREKKGKQVL